MENENLNTPEIEEEIPVLEEEVPAFEEEAPVYVPRPKWQIVLAWVGAAIVLIGFGTYLYHIATAGGI